MAKIGSQESYKRTTAKGSKGWYNVVHKNVSNC